VTNPVQADHLLSHYLGPSLQTATIRLAGLLIVLSAVVAVVIEIL
jgi:hypothetical protein